MATTRLSDDVVLIDSITEVLPEHEAMIVVTGSHGGLSSARYASEVRARLYVFNDAGVGKDRAGIAALSVLQEMGIAAAAVSHDTARIGEAAGTWESGVVSHMNTSAERIGLVAGRTLRATLPLRR